MARSGPLRLRLTGEGVTGSTYKLELDDKDISGDVSGVTVTLDVAEVNRAEIRYLCTSVEIEGDFKITHHCPLGGHK